MIAVAVLLPWLAMLLQKHPFKAVFTLVLQVSLLGWPPAALWAVIQVNADRRDAQYEQMLKLLRGH
jgi:uncharacterized membrane protein YqaE (UPF0057 family)